MAGAATVATAIVDFKGRSIQFNNSVRQAAKSAGIMTRELAKVERSVNSFNRKAQSLVRRLTGIRAAFALAGSAAGAAFLVKRVVDTTAQLDIQARTVGVSTEMLQQFNFMGEQLGLTAYQMGVGIQRFSRRMGDAARGSGELLPLLQLMNIQLRDNAGNLRPVIDVFLDYSEATRATGSAAEQLLLAFKAFDVEGARLVKILQQGREGIEGFAKEATNFGLVISNELLAKSRLLFREFNILIRQVQIGFQRAVLENTPQILATLRSISEQVPRVLEHLPRILALVIDGLKLLAAAFVGLGVAKIAAAGVSLYTGNLLKLVKALGASRVAVGAFNAVLAVTGGKIGLIVTITSAIAATIATFIGFKSATEDATIAFNSWRDSLRYRSLEDLNSELSVATNRLLQINEEIDRLRRLNQLGPRFGGAELERALENREKLVQAIRAINVAIKDQEGLLGGADNFAQKALERLDRIIERARASASGLSETEIQIQRISKALEVQLGGSDILSQRLGEAESALSSERIAKALRAFDVEILKINQDLSDTPRPLRVIDRIISGLRFNEQFNEDIQSARDKLTGLFSDLERKTRFDTAFKNLSTIINDSNIELSRLTSNAQVARDAIRGLLVEDFGDIRLNELYAEALDALNNVSEKNILGRINTELLTFQDIANRTPESEIRFRSLAKAIEEEFGANVPLSISKAYNELVEFANATDSISAVDEAAKALNSRIQDVTNQINKTTDLDIFFQETFEGLSPEQIKTLEALRDELVDVETQFANMKGPIIDLNRLANTFAEGFSRAFIDIISGAKDASEAFKRLFASISQVVLQAVVLRGITSAFSGVGLVSSFQGFASGGLSQGGPAIVGERGPEIVDYRTPYRVYTADELRQAIGMSGQSGGVENTNLEININGVNDAFDVRRAIREAIPEISVAVARMSNRQGNVASSLLR